MLYEYVYNGPVTSFGKRIASSFYALTYAKTSKKALSNVSYQFKEKNNLAKNAKIELYEKYLKMIRSVS